MQQTYVTPGSLQSGPNVSYSSTTGIPTQIPVSLTQLPYSAGQVHHQAQPLNSIMNTLATAGSSSSSVNQQQSIPISQSNIPQNLQQPDNLSNLPYLPGSGNSSSNINNVQQQQNQNAFIQQQHVYQQ